MEQNKKEEGKVLPAEQIEVTIGPNAYVIKRPKVGQIIDIERMKLRLTGGTHNQMLFGSEQSQQAYVLVDTVAVLSVLIPELSKDMLVESLLDLRPDQIKEVSKVYEDQVFPWLQQLRDLSK